MSLKGENILCVTSEWSGFTDIFEDKEPRGMPAFFKIIEGMSKQGAKVYIIVFSESLRTGVRKLKLNSNIHIIIILRWELKKIKSLILFTINSFKIFFITKKINPSFIYSLGVAGYMGKISSFLLKKPIGVRLFGINKYYKKYIEIGKIRFFFNSPLIFSIFYFKNNFILATDDGSRANDLFNSLGNKETDFYFWKNGYDSNYNLKNFKSDKKNPYIFYPARIAEKKQQIIAVNLLNELLNRGYSSFHLKIAGHITDKKYFNSLINYASKLRVESRVEYCGILNREKLLRFMNESVAVLSLQKISNLGNTAIEALNSKSVFLSYREPALEKFLENKKSAILIENIDEAVEEIGNVFNNVDYNSKIRKNGQSALKSNFWSWEERIQKEIGLIKLTMS